MSDRYVSSEEIVEFMTQHNLTHEEFDLLFGSASEGRASRRWKSGGAPRYVGILMAYANHYGLELMRVMAQVYLTKDSE